MATSFQYEPSLKVYRPMNNIYISNLNTYHLNQILPVKAMTVST